MYWKVLNEIDFNGSCLILEKRKYPGLRRRFNQLGKNDSVLNKIEKKGKRENYKNKKSSKKEKKEEEEMIKKSPINHS